MEKIIITLSHAGERLDRFLAREFFLYSRANIVKRIKAGEVLINGKKAKPSHCLEEDEVVMLENFSREVEDKSLFVNNEIPLKIIFENEDMLVLGKQADLQVHPSSNEKKKTLVNALLAHFPEIAHVHDESVGAELRPGIVHRLDKDTTGLIVIARNPEAFHALKANFKKREISKRYLAVVKGILKEKEGLIDKPLAKSSDFSKQVIARNNTKTTIREAQTKYKVSKEYGDYSLVELEPKTGRTHQIRIHLASIGHPIVGDLIYGKKDEKAEKGEAKMNADRQLLHASELEFSLFGKEYKFNAPLPEDFESFLASIKE